MKIPTSNDIAYETTFRGMMMLEISRIEASIANRAKIDSISSVSHELQLPPHRILGSVELRKDLCTGTGQAETIRMIEIYRHILLETMGQV